MKKLILVVLLSVPTWVGAQTVLWSEDFSNEADGAVVQNGTVGGTLGGSWSVPTTPTGGAASFSKQTYIIRFPFGCGNIGTLEFFQLNDTNTEGAWASNVVDITGLGDVSLGVNLLNGGPDAASYIRAYYRLNTGSGLGPEVLFGEVIGNDFISLSNPQSVILSGIQVQLVIRGFETTPGNFYCTVPNVMGFDDITLTQIGDLYSLNNGAAPWDWNEGTSWSTTDGGPACGCTPGVSTNVIIRSGNTITIPDQGGGNNAEAVRVTVRSGGALNFTANEILNINKGGSVIVQAGASLGLSPTTLTGAQITLNAIATNAITVDGTLTIGDIDVNAAATVNFSGNGVLTIQDDFLVDAAAVIANNMTGTFTVTDAVTNSVGGASITNAGSMTIAGITSIASPSIFTNNSIVTMSASNAAGVLSGTGTWTQGINSTLNYAGGTPAITTLNASSIGNTVNYNRPGAATLKNPSANTYYHLTISGLNVKTSSSNLIVAGDLIINGGSLAGLNPSTFNLTVNGTTTVVSGTFNDGSDTGVNTFVGNVSVATGNSFNSTAVTTTGNLVFRGGIAMANVATFAAGGATFDTNNQSLTGTSAMSFANNVTITGITVTNSNSAAFTITGTTTLTNGGFTDNNNASITTFVGAVSQSGTSAFNTTTVSTAANMVFRGGITNTGGTFTAGAATFNTNSQSIAGNSAISFANFVIVTGAAVTVTNNNTSSVSVTSSGLSLSGTGIWTQGANSTLNFAGSSISVNTFNASNAGNTVNYNSPDAPAGNAQTIRVPATTYTNLTFNNTFATPPQLTAAGNVTVTGVLTMTSGRVNLNANTITLSSSALGALVHGLTSASGWMYGGSIVRTYGNTQAVTEGTARSLFPLGSSTDWRPFFVGVNSVNNTAGTISVSHTDAATTTVVSIADTNPVATIVRRHDAFWRAVTTGITAGSWRILAGGTTFGTIAAGAADIRLSTPSGVVGTNQAGSGGPTDWRVLRTGLSVAQLGGNNFHLSSTNATSSPLPIKLLYFSATLLENEVEMKWATAQEINNDFFTIEKSLNPEKGFEQVSRVAGQENSTLMQEYSSVDKNPYVGLSYYRLKQTDFDGTSTYSKLVSVNYAGSTLASLNVYPNPLKDKQAISVEITGLAGMNEVPIVIYNFLGQKILETNLSVNQGGVVQEEFSFEKPLSAGVFIVKAGPTLQLTQRLVVE